MMNFRNIILILSLLIFVYGNSIAGNPLPVKLFPPKVDKDSWVMIEIWPEVQDITLAAYFLDFSYEKNRNLCNATKRVFDRDQVTQSKKTKKSLTSYRICISVNDAISQGYIRDD